MSARADGEAEVEGGGPCRIAAGDGEQRLDAGLHAAFAHARQALGDENAVIAVERHHVGDGAERDQVEQVGELGALAVGEGAAPAQLRA